MKTILHILSVSALMMASICGAGAQNHGNSLPATDALGRKLPGIEQTGEARQKYVGLFYWTWHTDNVQKHICIPSEYIAEAPEAAYDYNHPIWKKDVGSNFWGEPLFGFYIDTDRWVLRKHAEMLAEAGVDVIFFDCTNGSFTWRSSYQALCEVFTQARKDGVKTPQIAFMMAFWPTEGSKKAMIDVYEDLYKPAEYKDLFFMWDGKPLIMAHPEAFTEADDYAANKEYYDEILNHFTFRPGQPEYNSGPKRPDDWGWLEIYPQNGYVKKKDGGYEQATVGVAQNWTAHNGLSAMNMPGAFGRSYTARNGHSGNPEDVARGLNFQEQWDRAMEIDPDLIFITGWNEWIMGRFDEWLGQPNAFPDQFDQEHSRDIEPMRGGHGDSYYYQMIYNIRRFKGMDSGEPAPRKKHKISVDGRFQDWKDAMEYKAIKGNTIHRDSRGWADLHYTNTTGRNDIIMTKAAHDSENLCFYIECAEDITPSSDDAWMRLFIDIDRDKSSGWEGYDFIINRESPSETAKVEKSSNGWEWSVYGEATFKVNGNKMEIAIPRTALGLGAKDKIDIEFKWADNLQTDGDIYDFYLSGDVAPLGRFNYVYSSR